MHPQEQSKLFEMIEQLNDKVDRLIKKPSGSFKPTRSEQIDLLAIDFAKAQSEYPQIGYNRNNPFYKSKYADLDQIMYSIRPILGKHGLSFFCETQFTEDERHVIYAQLLHKSGQWISSTTRIVPESQDKNYNQAFAKSLTYLKRHQAMALLNVTCCDDPMDNDQEYDFPDPIPMNKPKASSSSITPVKTYEQISTDQWTQMTNLLEGYPEIAKNIMDKMNIKSLRDFPKDDFNAGINRIHKLINDYNSANQ